MQYRLPNPEWRHPRLSARGVLCFAVVLATATISLGNAYKIRKLDLPQPHDIEFVFPPGSDLEFKNGELKSNYKCQGIELDPLDGKDYLESLQRIAKAKYKRGRESDCSAGEKFRVTASEGRLFVMVNYEEMFATKGRDVAARFNAFAIELLAWLSTQTGLPAQTGLPPKNWAPSIPQNVAEKVFELCPTPAASALSRFGVKRDGQNSMVILNPHFALQVDNVKQVRWGDMGEPGAWQMDLIGRTRVPIHRDENGFLRQVPHIISTTFPHNRVAPEGTVQLLSSSGDIQFSAGLRQKTYFAVVNQKFRTNNSMGGNTGNCTNDDSESSTPNWTDCNFVIAASDRVAELLEWPRCLEGEGLRSPAILLNLRVDRENLRELEARFEEHDQSAAVAEQIRKIRESLKEIEDLIQLLQSKEAELGGPPGRSACPNIEFAVFGLRNLITPTFQIWINGELREVALGSTPLALSLPLARETELYRLHRGEYIRVKGWGSRLILLPGDKLEF